MIKIKFSSFFFLEIHSSTFNCANGDSGKINEDDEVKENPELDLGTSGNEGEWDREKWLDVVGCDDSSVVVSAHTTEADLRRKMILSRREIRRDTGRCGLGDIEGSRIFYSL